VLTPELRRGEGGSIPFTWTETWFGLLSAFLFSETEIKELTTVCVVENWRFSFFTCRDWLAAELNVAREIQGLGIHPSLWFLTYLVGFRGVSLVAACGRLEVHKDSSFFVFFKQTDHFHCKKEYIEPGDRSPAEKQFFIFTFFFFF